MRGTRLVHLPINFRYSDNGTFKEDCAVSLSAPSLDQFSVHNAMVAYASEATRNNDKEQALTFAAMAPALETLMLHFCGEIRLNHWYRRAAEWVGTAWGHAVAPSTPVQDYRRHVSAWQQHFAELFGAEALKLKRRPPLTTLATRAMCTTRSCSPSPSF